ncbi:hypothetical protein LTR64_007338 [Lithohypha guttulata]|uniref:uncharacterized protein n=1 Tax=Lithohypha guttulata TaxID=1690604 RepID=UPI002DDF490B|nr:hypothetical protein LTR51_004104 [Lithohypha guttulata]
MSSRELHNRRDERQDLDNDWVHDRYDDEPESRNQYQSKPRGGRREDYNDRRSPGRDGGRGNDRDGFRDGGRDRAPLPAKIRVDNLHYDLTEDDLFDLFTRIAPVKDVRLQYDRAGRSDGTAFVTYDLIGDARLAVKEFDGANAKGQPIRLTILPLPPRTTRRENPFDRVENPRSLFDRIEAPSGRGRRRSESPVGDAERDYSRNGSRRGQTGSGRDHRSDTSKPPPENIDRYVPGQNGRGGRRPGERRERPPRDAPRSGARPKKTAAELDAEMEDYWGTDAGKETNQPAQHATTGGDDIDMIE